MLDTADTIVAIASAPGGAYRGIIRLSGPQTIACLEKCFSPAGGCESRSEPQPSAAIQAGHLQLLSGQVLPALLYLWPTPRSYTRQIAAELHTIGSPPLLDAAVATLYRYGARVAEPGEFTLRAFLAGRLDLTQAEAVLGVIDARNPRELDSALIQLAGGLAAPLMKLREGLLDLLAQLEAGLDFVEEDIEFITAAELESQLAAAEAQLEQIASQISSRGEAAAEPRVVFCGAPNVGKSSLLNALAGDDAAIVSDVAGTTRDYVVRRILLYGRPILLIDTAGIETSTDEGSISAAAQSFRDEQALAADLHLWCFDASDRGRESMAVENMDRPTAGSTAIESRPLSVKPRLIVGTKCDLAPASDARFGGSLTLPAGAQSLPTSSRTGEGIEQLRASIHREITAAQSAASIVPATAARCRESLSQAQAALSRARHDLAQGRGEEFIAASIRAALEDLGRIAGVIYTDDLLGRIFSRFCIGK